MSRLTFESNYKKLGLIPISGENTDQSNHPRYKPYIKVAYLPANTTVRVDFTEFRPTRSALFFINSNQHFEIQHISEGAGFMIFYNRDFYCIQIHDREVACDGLLFNNIFEMPMTELSAKEDLIIRQSFMLIQEELETNASSQEEMIRTYLKQVIIRATRIWKEQNLGDLNKEPAQELDFFRDFSRLVEIHFREKHSVSDYADLLAVSAKTLSNKFSRLHLAQPNEIIKDRILLEAKRLLTYSSMTVKEIAYDLGYEDPAYFNRLFANKTGDTPVAFRKKYNATSDKH
jgi:AraC family transcriptional regulator, transcriptional activator of pobA